MSWQIDRVRADTRAFQALITGDVNRRVDKLFLSPVKLQPLFRRFRRFVGTITPGNSLEHFVHPTRDHPAGD